MFFDDDDVLKRVFGYPAGKVRMRDGLVKMISPHETYVEPFCGSAGVFFAKARSKSEVLADANEDVVEALKAIQSLTEDEAKALRAKKWVGAKAHFAKLAKSKPTTKVDRLYKFLYLTVFSYMKARKSFSSDREGVTTKIAERAIKAKDRLAKVTIERADYADTIKKHDSEKSFFYIDPPYVGTDAGVGEKDFDEERMMKVLKSIKGRFVMTYGTKGKADFVTAGFRVQKVDVRRTLANSEGVDREKIMSTFVVSNFAAPTYKALEGIDGIEIEEPTTTSDVVARIEKREGGAHSHILDRKKKETGLDGAHCHLFALEPDREGARARVLYTLFDGPHQHKLPKEAANDTKEDGKHKHKIRIFHYGADYYDEGLILDTETSEGHVHKLLVASTVMDGLHQHDLTLPDGKKVTSLLPGEYASLFKSDEHDEIPEPGERVGAMKIRFVDDRLSADFWIEDGARAVGWAFDVQTGPFDIGKSREIADRFSVEGNRNLRPMVDRFVEARSLGSTDRGVLKMDGPVEGGEILHGDSCIVEHGLHTDSSHEYFLTKGDELVGALDVIRSFVDGWEARIRKSDLVPAVLSPRAVQEGWIPPKGVSALPSSIEKQIPAELRYWEAEGDSARELRDLLVASRMVTKDRLGIVNGEIRLIDRQVVSTFELLEAEELPIDWQLKKLEEQSGEVKVREAFSILDLGDDAAAFVELCHDSIQELESSVGIIEKHDGDFAISCADSPEARRQLSKLGRVFRFIPSDPRHAVEVSKRIFVASFPLMKSGSVEWLDHEEHECGTSKAAEEEPSIDPIEDELSKHANELPIVKADEEQRVVTGVVLEPETTDSQGDIYSADEIRKAAHGFMERFQNVGLQHKRLINHKARIVESFLAPVDMKIGKAAVKKGTWVVAVHVLDDAVWKAVKTGELTGFSIGGSAIRKPVTSA